MSEIDQIDIPQVPQGRLKAPLMVAGGGLAAAFCAASCCGLPVLLGSLGLGSGWLVTIAWIAAPHRIALLIAAVICSWVVLARLYGVVVLLSVRRKSRRVGWWRVSS